MDLPHCVRNVNDIITCAGSGHHLRPDIGVRSIKEMPGSVASGTLCIRLSSSRTSFHSAMYYKEVPLRKVLCFIQGAGQLDR